MRQNANDVAIHVEADYSPSLMRQLSDGLLDIGVMYNPRQTPGLIIEDLLEETLLLVATNQREVVDGWVEDYVFVDWGEEFRRLHGEAFPDMDNTRYFGRTWVTRARVHSAKWAVLVIFRCAWCSPLSIKGELFLC